MSKIGTFILILATVFVVDTILWSSQAIRPFRSGGGSGAQTAGPIPVPPNIGVQALGTYPLQPGFTGITDISGVTGAGYWQLTADDVTATTMVTLAAGTVFDCGGHGFYSSPGVAEIFNFLTATGTANNVIRNCNKTQITMTVQGSGVQVINNEIQLGVTHENLANATYLNNHFSGTSDDNVLVGGQTSCTGSSWVFVNNLFDTTGDFNLEGTGCWKQGIIADNYFRNCLCNGAIGGYYNAGITAGTFTFGRTIIVGNIVDMTTEIYPYKFAQSSGSLVAYSSDAALTAVVGLGVTNALGSGDNIAIANCIGTTLTTCPNTY